MKRHRASDEPIDIVFENPEKRQRLDSKESKNKEGLLRSELASQQEEIRALTKENKYILS